MADSTYPFDSSKRGGEIFQLSVEEAVHIYPGVMVALNSDGRALPARDAADLSVFGRSITDADNSAGADDALKVQVERGVFSFLNSATNPISADDIGKMVYVEDDKTVATTTTNKCKAGRALAIDPVTAQVWVDTRPAIGAIVVAADATTNGLFTTQAAAATAAVDLAALKVVVNAMAVELEKATDLLRLHQTALQAGGAVK